VAVSTLIYFHSSFHKLKNSLQQEKKMFLASATWWGQCVGI